MKNKKRYFIYYPLTVIIVLTAVAWFWFSPHLKPNVAVQLEDPRPLFFWIYARSNRISQLTAMEIALKAAKTRRPLLILALIEVESQFVPTAVSSKGAIGLSQVMFEHHGKALVKAGIIQEKRDLFNIDSSIKAADLILDDMLTQSNGNVVKALEKYLGGQDGAYVKRILTNLASLYLQTMPLKKKP